MSDFQLVDLWRYENSSARGFSRRQLVLNKLKQSRIDLIMVNSSLLNMVSSALHSFLPIGDHAAGGVFHGVLIIAYLKIKNIDL